MKESTAIKILTKELEAEHEMGRFSSKDVETLLDEEKKEEGYLKGLEDASAILNGRYHEYNYLDYPSLKMAYRDYVDLCLKERANTQDRGVESLKSEILMYLDNDYIYLESHLKELVKAGMTRSWALEYKLSSVGKRFWLIYKVGAPYALLAFLLILNLTSIFGVKICEKLFAL